MTQQPPYTGSQPGTSEQINAIVVELSVLYPHARYDLNFSNPLELLVATQLAAQCTDERVNAVTKTLFQKYHSAEDYVNVSQEEFEQDIKPTGFYRNKAKIFVPPANIYYYIIMVKSHKQWKRCSNYREWHVKQQI